MARALTLLCLGAHCCTIECVDDGGAQVLREKHRESVGSAGSVLVASASLIPVEWDKAANWQTIERTATEAAQKGAGLVLMSEGFLEGYVIEAVNTANATFSAMPEPAKQDLLRRFLEIGEPSDGPYLAKAKALTKKLRIWLQFGFLHRVGGQVYNGVALFDPDGDMVNLYHKTHFAQGYGTNPSCYTPGSDYPTAATPFARVGHLICFDRHFPEIVRSLAVGGATLILNPSFPPPCPALPHYDAPLSTGTNTHMLQTRAYENHVYYIFTNAHQTLFISEEGLIEAMGSEGTVTYHSDLGK